jgi:hypothetical protein
MTVWTYQPVQLEDVPDADGMNRRVGILASLITRPSGLAAVIQAPVTPAGRAG